MSIKGGGTGLELEISPSEFFLNAAAECLPTSFPGDEVIRTIDRAGCCLSLDHHQVVRAITQTVNCDRNDGTTVRPNISASLERTATPGDAPTCLRRTIAHDPAILNRRVTSTNPCCSTFSPGFQVRHEGLTDSFVAKRTVVYSYLPIPKRSDSNNTLPPGVSGIVG